MRIALIEDCRSLAKGVAYRLKDDGHAVDVLHDGAEAEHFLAREDADIIILDITLPSKSGLDVLRDLRRRGDPRLVMLLTARTSTEDRVAGLDAGADDYLAKPFAMDELSARVRALGRRKTEAPRREVGIGGLRFDLDTPQVFAGEEAVAIPRREIAVLAALAEANGRAVSKDILLTQVYGAGSDVGDKAIEVYVSRLRRRLAEHGVSIRVHRGIGYSLSAGPP